MPSSSSLSPQFHSFLNTGPRGHKQEALRGTWERWHSPKDYSVQERIQTGGMRGKTERYPSHSKLEARAKANTT